MRVVDKKKNNTAITLSLCSEETWSVGGKKARKEKEKEVTDPLLWMRRTHAAAAAPAFEVRTHFAPRRPTDRSRPPIETTTRAAAAAAALAAASQSVPLGLPSVALTFRANANSAAAGRVSHCTALVLRVKDRSLGRSVGRALDVALPARNKTGVGHKTHSRYNSVDAHTLEMK